MRDSNCRLTGLVRTSRGGCPATVHASVHAGARSSDVALGSDNLLGSLLGGAAKSVWSMFVSIVNDGAATALRVTASLMGSTTGPALQSTWFSATYWRVAALSTLLTLPFLFAAAVHALVRSDPGMLARAAFGYLPLAMLAVAIAAPLTMLVLAATDEMCAFLAGAAGHSDAAFLARAASDLTNRGAIDEDPFVAFVVGLITVAATLALWLELLIRAVAVDVIVLLLPLFFAAMVWPARRVWAVRSIETLFALILSKLAIVAVLTLGGAALGTVSEGGTSGLTALLTGATLILLAVLSPWALLRLLPLHEVAAAAAGGLSQAPHAALGGIGSEVRRRFERSGGDSSERGSPGLGAEDDPASPLERLAGASGGGLRIAAAGLHAAGGAAGAGAVATIDGGADHPKGVHANGVGEATAQVGGERPPIPAPFDGGDWKGYVIGEDGDEVMRAPVIAEPASDDPPPPTVGPEQP